MHYLGAKPSDMRIPSFYKFRVLFIGLSITSYILSFVCLRYLDVLLNSYKYFFFAGSVFLLLYFIQYFLQYRTEKVVKNEG